MEVEALVVVAVVSAVEDGGASAPDVVGGMPSVVAAEVGAVSVEETVEVRVVEGGAALLGGAEAGAELDGGGATGVVGASTK